MEPNSDPELFDPVCSAVFFKKKSARGISLSCTIFTHKVKKGDELCVQFRQILDLLPAANWAILRYTPASNLHQIHPFQRFCLPEVYLLILDQIPLDDIYKELRQMLFNT